MIENSDPFKVIKTIEDLVKIEEGSKDLEKEIQRSKDQGSKISNISRVKWWFLNNPGVVISPKVAKNGLDIDNNKVQFPRVKYEYLRKTILPRLREEGIIRYHWDPLNNRYIPGYYE